MLPQTQICFVCLLKRFFPRFQLNFLSVLGMIQFSFIKYRSWRANRNPEIFALLLFLVLFGTSLKPYSQVNMKRQDETVFPRSFKILESPLILKKSLQSWKAHENCRRALEVLESLVAATEIYRVCFKLLI